MTDNLYGFKCRYAPKDYIDGPVKIFTREEIEEWEKSDGAKECYAKIEAQNGMTQDEIKFLDSLKEYHAEVVLSEIMEGVVESRELSNE